MRAESRSLEQTKIIKSTFKRCVGQCERGGFHTATTNPFIFVLIQILALCGKMSLLGYLCQFDGFLF